MTGLELPSLKDFQKAPGVTDWKRWWDAVDEALLKWKKENPAPKHYGRCLGYTDDKGEFHSFQIEHASASGEK